MKLTDLIALSQNTVDGGNFEPGPRAYTLADSIISLLDHAPSLPCGHTVAGARDTDGPYVELDGDTMSPEDARGLAVAILRAADAADSARAADEGEG
jgi:hypothetical protein